MQGYVDLDDEAKSRYALSLRFTPMVCTILIAVGLGLRSPIWLGVVAVVALIGAALPSGHPVDLGYNLVIRHLFGARRLPPNPGPRRFACFVAALFLTGSALAFQYSLPVLGFALGGFLCAVGVVVVLN